MAKAITFLLATLLAFNSFGQNFEGKIVYKNSYKSKMPNVTDEQFTTMMGSTQDYFIKNGDYKSVANGSLFQWQLYVNKDNKLYTKLANSETLLWNDGATNPDEILKAEVNKDVTEVLGFKCDELVLTCKSGTQKYYFNTKLAVDTKLFVNHKFGNWYDFLSKSNSLSLKSIVDNGQFTLESVATEVKEMKLDKTIFDLPADAKTMKSPY
ncbi:hypothetical protein [Flavihumibacter profundi]|uniref:hypothetical protein n=1 Tax=Flavihumibacter profundi TaxID=2716883 RepID=UPI001CC663CA|nr:hypothetical protein [Flavihumibacter profundi]MBZ5857745.1 hypothetical protein [Flavihumibacter profundi]